ncbi:MAG: hypothetical protein HWQ35_33995 [Nostoc sp. NMS1]|uniref:hypothetical protein n=1 Tax=unclassified Nostoc TaxID=2593658 RepID=UPI0025E3A00C|nr:MULTISPECIES: hypothetical protein [unclassified Nostoc]MBN3911369.1 hypothetical protein [Nostoc sp. NMS1]MBN3995113.1 hypothetical protein [Nostoc sp. NMS2]
MTDKVGVYQETFEKKSDKSYCDLEMRSQCQWNPLLQIMPVKKICSDCLKSQAIVNKKPGLLTLTQLGNAALDSAVAGTGKKTCGSWLRW